MGYDVGIGHDLQSQTSEVCIFTKEYTSGSGKTTRYHLIDTPGFDNSSRTDSEVLKSLSEFLAEQYRKDIKLAGIIYLHRITDVRMTSSAVTNFSMFKKLCGGAFFPQIVLATTRWDDLSGGKEEGHRREAALIDTDDWWGLMAKRGSKVFRFKGTEASAKEIIFHLGSLRLQAAMKIQTEMVDENKSFDATSAGLEVAKRLVELHERLEEEFEQIKSLREEMAADRNRDNDLIAHLKGKEAHLMSQIESAQSAREKLHASNRQEVARNNARHRQELDDLNMSFANAEKQRVRDEEQRAAYEKHRAAAAAQVLKEHQTAMGQLTLKIEELEAAQSAAVPEQQDEFSDYYGTMVLKRSSSPCDHASRGMACMCDSPPKSEWEEWHPPTPPNGYYRQ
ncbi:hypothetical protein ACHAQH_009890 [Verticillium albo-atrum]